MVLAVTGRPNVAYLILAVEGAAMVVVDVLALTSMQRILGNEVLGRAFGAIDSLTVAGMLAGSVIAPVVVRAASLEVALVVGGGLTVGASLLVLRRARAIDRRAAERASIYAPRVAFLEGLDLFEGTSRATLEALAEMLAPESVDAGVVLIRQGDEPDDLFLIADGAMQVAHRDEAGVERVVAEVGPGTYVGEIGLLRGVPRTATVTTITPCEVYRLDGQEFLRIVTEGAVRASGLNAGMQARLASHRQAEPSA
jgi:CRP-like cAMP-binding protein